MHRSVPAPPPNYLRTFALIKAVVAFTALHLSSVFGLLYRLLTHAMFPAVESTRQS
jgi:hypothetical protein